MSKKSELESRVGRLAEPEILEEGVELVDVEFVREGKVQCLRVLIDKRGGVTIDECEAVSRRIDPILEEAGLMADVDTFEVSSPGLDRPLKKPADFVRHMGEKVDVGLYKAIDGDKTITGTLTDYDDGGLTLETADGPVKLEKGEIAVVKQHLDF
ncbi:MAG: ribosome maturation factor RimP [Lachnospiraceae bacterium]|nr:ribosome maturation factor RimP [Lachnospiraceae bacterium]MBR2753303.1 ribosome maturation factor RimP [Lachnospiraceae bacterium]